MTLKQLDTSIRQLANAFLVNPFDYFQERELHSQFFAICRDQFGSAKVRGNPVVEVNLFRQEYNTVWRLVRSDSFADRYDDLGKPGSLDFAILRADFVARENLLCVVNKDESIRRTVRKMARDTTHSPVVMVGIEFKMAHVRSALEISAREVQELEAGMIVDAQKLAQERVEHGHVVGFCHGRALGDARAEQIAKVCASAFHRIHPNGSLHVYLVAPSLAAGILNREFAPGEAQIPTPPPVSKIPKVEPIVPPVPVHTQNRRPVVDQVYSSADGRLFLVCGARAKNSRVVPLGVNGDFFPASELIANPDLNPVHGDHEIIGCRPNNDQEYEYAPPPGESNAPCPVPCWVLILDRGKGETSRVSVVGFEPFLVQTHHLKREK